MEPDIRVDVVRGLIFQRFQRRRWPEKFTRLRRPASLIGKETFGAQLLAEALGGRIFPNKHKEIGWHAVSVNREGQESFLFQNIPASFITFHWHSDHFSLPGNCTRLAASKASVNQAFVCKDRPLVGLQFHPEYTREMVNYYAAEHSQDWVPDEFVSGKDKVLARTKEIPDTYWLMETLLNNMEQEFTNAV